MTRTVVVLDSGVIVTGIWTSPHGAIAAQALAQAALTASHAVVLTDVEIRGAHPGSLYSGYMVIRKSAIQAVSTGARADDVTVDTLMQSMPSMVAGR